jgi:ParB-like chromosome segregation protein Spo0J
MPPILVFPVGRDFYVIDGHHRLAAYDMAKWTKAIPAQVFTGNLRDAERVALRSNNKDKLPLTREDRTEAAWWLVREEDARDSIRSIMDDTGASKGAVNTMRATLKKLKEMGYDAKEIRGATWNRARQVANGSAEERGQEDWIEAEAQKLVDAIVNAKLGARIIKHSDITALALAKLAPGLPDALMAEWAPEPEFDPHENDPDNPDIPF